MVLCGVFPSQLNQPREIGHKQAQVFVSWVVLDPIKLKMVVNVTYSL